MALAEHADRVDAVAVPVAGDRDVARRAVVEDVIDHVGAVVALRGVLQRAIAERAPRRVAAARSSAGRSCVLCGSGRPGSWPMARGIARPGAAEDADVGLAVAVPVAGDRQVALVAELGPQVAFVPLAVAVEIDEPLAVVEDADVGDAVAVEVAGDRNAVSHAEADEPLWPSSSFSPLPSIHSEL